MDDAIKDIYVDMLGEYKGMLGEYDLQLIQFEIDEILEETQ